MDDLREKVIRGMEICLKEDANMCEIICPYFHQCGAIYENNEALMKDALSLLKAQEPKKPEVIMINGNGIQSGSCPCCGETVNDYRNEKYCGKCGQRLRWLE